MRLALGSFPTPLQPLRGAAAIAPHARCEILVKRDDLAGWGIAGNKTRPLELLVADALRRDAEVVVGAGAPSSNFIAALAQTAASQGLRCELLVPAPAEPSVTVRLARVVGAVVREVPVTRHELDAAVEGRVAELAAEGVRAYGVPRGGASAVGAVGFAHAVPELLEQLGPREPVTIVVPIGSGGTVSGLLAGLELAGSAHAVVGVSTSRPAAELADHLEQLAAAALDILSPGQARTRPLTQRLTIVDRAAGPTEPDLEVSRALYAHGGLVVDDHYGMPTAGVAMEVARSLRGGTLVLWHTGGMAGLEQVLDLLEQPLTAGARP